MSKLYGLTHSPYSERAKFALDHHRVAYTYHEHVPLLGEPLLRLKVRGQGLPKATVPIFESDEGKVYVGGMAIARHADEVGKGTPLFRAADDAAIDHFAALSDQLLHVGRGWVLAHLVASSVAQAEALPPFIPTFARGAFAPMSGMVSRFLQKKHGTADQFEEDVRTVARPILDEVRRTRGERAYLLSNFSYADMSICAALGLVRPRATAHMGAATRAVWSNEDLIRDYGDLLAWRDEIYEKHRKTPV